MTIDFEKCFDRIEYGSIKGAFQYLGFGERFISMMFLLFNKLEMCTVSNGFNSPFFFKTRGVNQGCPASPLIYSFCGEIMSQLITQNTNIKGITINGVENLLAQFADDTAAYLKCEDLVLQEFTRTLGTVEQQMGLKVSYEKTTIYRAGSLVNGNARLYTQKDLKWSNEAISLLGVSIPCDGSEDVNNWNEIVVKIKKTFNNWWNRQATLMGKVLIVNCLIGSLFVYKMSTMCNVSDIYIAEIDKLIRNFLWSGRRPKISYMLLQKRKCDGGLKLVNLKAKQKAIKISWLFKDNDNCIRSCMYEALDKNLGELIWRCNLNKKHVKLLFAKSFWAEVLEAWSEINFSDECSKKCEIKNQIIWYNSMLLSNNKPIFWKHWWEKGIITVSDLLDDRDNFKTAQDLNVNWLELNIVLASMPSDWKNVLFSNQEGVCEASLFEKFSKIKTTSKYAYNLLIADKEFVLKYCQRWEDVENVMINKENYYKAFQNLYRF